MAKYEERFRGNFDDFLGFLEKGIRSRSVTSSYEERSDYERNGVRCAVRAYERYSMIGGSRVSLTFVLIGVDDDLFVSVISTGGSQAMLIKINTIGETNFLRSTIKIIEEYKKGHK